MNIKKSKGITHTENLLSTLCDRTFLTLWSYPNPYKRDGKELCDLIAVYENHIFIFFDRESRHLAKHAKDIQVNWERWKKEAIDKQVLTANGAERYICNIKGKIYLDNKRITEFPINISHSDIKVHKIIVAHGAEDACKAYSSNNINGSLGIIYSKKNENKSNPLFIAHLASEDRVHLFDSSNLQLIFNELDTFQDFTDYILEKEQTLMELDYICYSGEEDLLALYLENFDETKKKHFLNNDLSAYDAMYVPEGLWQEYVKSNYYKNKLAANKNSYVWDNIIQMVGSYGLSHKLKGNANIFAKENPLYEMAKENRLSRRILADKIITFINNVPNNITQLWIYSAILFKEKPPKTAYVILQIVDPDRIGNDEGNGFRKYLLDVACGAAKNRYKTLEQIIGIAFDSPKYHNNSSTDLILLNCKSWTENDTNNNYEANKKYNFFSTDLKLQEKTECEFPI